MRVASEPDHIDIQADKFAEKISMYEKEHTFGPADLNDSLDSTILNLTVTEHPSPTGRELDSETTRKRVSSELGMSTKKCLGQIIRKSQKISNTDQKQRSHRINRIDFNSLRVLTQKNQSNTSNTLSSEHNVSEHNASVHNVSDLGVDQ